MSHMTVLIISLVLTAICEVVCIVMVARETERTHPELGDLPAALLTIVLIVAFSYTVDKMRQLDAMMNDASLEDGEQPTER